MGKGAVILISHKQARLKPCLRCGYSLRYIAGAKNCPECGLAVRISLSGNSGLEWSNPRWQRFRAVGFSVLALGLICRVLSFALGWVINWADEDYYSLADTTMGYLDRIDRYAGQAAPIFCGLALCLLARSERRHPDRSRLLRGIGLGAGILLIIVGLLARYTLFHSRSAWIRRVLFHAVYDPWIPLVVSVVACAHAHHIGKRGGSRLLRRLSQVPLWLTAAGVVVWLFNINQLFWPLSSILSDAAFPLSMIPMLAVAIRVLRSGAREADLNWVTDP